MQIDRMMPHLGNYHDEADAARAFDRLARVLCRPLNFPEDDKSEIVGRRSEGADQAVVTSMEAAKTFLKATNAAERAKNAAKVQSQKL